MKSGGGNWGCIAWQRGDLTVDYNYLKEGCWGTGSSPKY